MSKPSKHGPNKAKSIIAQPLFRCRQERPAKGKGSYRREAFQSKAGRLLTFWPPEALDPTGMIRSAPDCHSLWTCACPFVFPVVGTYAN